MTSFTRLKSKGGKKNYSSGANTMNYLLLTILTNKDQTF